MYLYTDYFLLYICIYKSIFYMFMAYIFSHQQLQLLGGGGNLFTSVPPLDIGFLFLLVGDARVSSLLPFYFLL